MARKIGSPKTGGRKKGTPNKKTLLLEESLELYGIDIVSELTQTLRELEPSKKADVLIQLMAYVYPKRKAIEYVMPEIPHEPIIIEFVNP